MLNEQKQALLDRIRAYLEADDMSTADNTDTAGETDLYTLFVEIAALKNEVKLESRQVKTALDEFKNVFALLQTSHEQLTGELERNRAEQQELGRNALRPLLLESLELYDRLEIGLQTLRRYRPSLFAWLHKRERALLAAVSEAQEITLRRVQQVLAAHGVTALQTVGNPLDPYTMRAQAITQRADLANGVVVEELRKGFRWDNEILRPAEVKVNKHETTST